MTREHVLILIVLLLSLLLMMSLVMIFVQRKKPAGLMHIDEYLNKDVYRMLYFLPLGELKKRRYVVLKVETQQWSETREDYSDYDEIQ